MGVHVSHCCARQGGYERAQVPTLVRGCFNGPPLWICRCLITGALNSRLFTLGDKRTVYRANWKPYIAFKSRMKKMLKKNDAIIKYVRTRNGI